MYPKSGEKYINLKTVCGVALVVSVFLKQERLAKQQCHFGQ